MESETQNQSVLLGQPVESAAIQTSNPEENFESAPDGFAADIARATRIWIQYGMFGFAVVCIFIGAVKGLFGL